MLTWSLRFTSTYSQKAYPLDRPVALSFTRLKAFRGPNDVSSSFTWHTKTKRETTLRRSHLPCEIPESSGPSETAVYLIVASNASERRRSVGGEMYCGSINLVIIQVIGQAADEELVSRVWHHCGHNPYRRSTRTRITHTHGGEGKHVNEAGDLQRKSCE